MGLFADLHDPLVRDLCATAHEAGASVASSLVLAPVATGQHTQHVTASDVVALVSHEDEPQGGGASGLRIHEALGRGGEWYVRLRGKTAAFYMGKRAIPEPLPTYTTPMWLDSLERRWPMKVVM